MNIKNNILKHYLKNCFFINGTAYAGKSTMCKMLAEKYDLILFGENYGLDRLLKMITPEDQPNLSYFNTMKSWQEFVNRTPEEYLNWYIGNSYEVSEFEILELIRLSSNKKVIVDTNIPLEILKQIADYNQVAIMLSPQSLSVDMFFEREDEEKQFLLSQINQSENPKQTMQNFRNCIAKINSQEIYDQWLNSGFFTIVRENTSKDTRFETLSTLARHFGLCSSYVEKANEGTTCYMDKER